MLAIVTPPTEYPISLTEVRQKLRQSAPAGNPSILISVPHDLHSAGTETGSSITLTGYTASAALTVGAVGGGESVTAKLQHSTDASTWEDVEGGAFTVVTTANQNQTFNLTYSGGRTYLRGIGTTVGDAEWGIQIALFPIVTDEDANHTRLIDSATEWAQNFLRSQFVTATRIYKFRRFPLGSDKDYAAPGIITIPWGNVLSVSWIKYYDAAGTLQTISSADYVVELTTGQIWPAFGELWPYPQDRPNAVQVQFTCGYGAATAVPAGIKQALLSHVAFHNEHSGDDASEPPQFLQNLLSPWEWDGRIVNTPQYELAAKNYAQG
jgi:hypothetical protein